MSKKNLHATNFRKVLELFNDGHDREAESLLRIIQEDYLNMYEENKELRSQIKEVAEILDLAECMEFDGQKYWIDEDNEKTGPYCQVCYDRDGVLIRLQERSKHWECYSCQNLFVKMPTGNFIHKSRPKKESKPLLRLFS
ncbi:hypothetical protein [Maridesulfovibrio sp.]|uniref:hypothetical protein n=1 Tax=Maridesulfovibrio sp. TaxID=2795000 RepID=UPI002A18810E|nr:hypothetical protein [Maridesulfovibrio sp.]